MRLWNELLNIIFIVLVMNDLHLFRLAQRARLNKKVAHLATATLVIIANQGHHLLLSIRRAVITFSMNNMGLLSSDTLQENMEKMLTQRMSSDKAPEEAVRNWNVGQATKTGMTLPMSSHQLLHPRARKSEGIMINLQPVGNQTNWPRKVVTVTP